MITLSERRRQLFREHFSMLKVLLLGVLTGRRGRGRGRGRRVKLSLAFFKMDLYCSYF